MPATMVNVRKGVRVRHPIFGDGLVTGTEGADLADFRIMISFFSGTTKTLLLQYANLRVINTQNQQEVSPC